MTTTTFAYVGCFTTVARQGRGKGISVYSIDAASDAWELVQLHTTMENPVSLAIDSSQRYLYAAHGSTDKVSAHAIDSQTGRLRFLNSQLTAGVNALHLTVAPSNRHVVVANGPGIAVFPIDEDGSLAPASDVVIPQPGARPHQVFFDVTGRYVFATGKGVDRIFVYGFDGTNGKLVPKDPPFGTTRDGYAPRHGVMHPTKPYVYLIGKEEGGSAVCAFHWNGDKAELRPFQLVPTTPPNHKDKSKGAEIAIAPSGKFIYISDRGHDNIVTLAIDANTDMLTAIAWDATRGEKARFFALEKGRIYAANQSSDTIAVFDVDPRSGKLTATGGLIETATPTCIVISRQNAQ